MIDAVKSAAMLLVLSLPNTASISLVAAEVPVVRGLWVWKTATVLATPDDVESLRRFCAERKVNEVYLSLPGQDGLSDVQLADVIARLHASKLRVEALFGSTDADLPGRPREQLLNRVRSVVEFNQRHPAESFDGVHLDVEPHQRPENKGTGNLRFLANLAETFRSVRAIVEPAGLSLNVDIPNKVLKGNLEQRRLLVTSVPRFTLMLYELNSPNDGATTAQKVEKLRTMSEKYLRMAYEGLNDAGLATMGIGLRVSDYGERLPEMLASLEEAHADNPRFVGWAWHCYNDHVRSR